MAWGNWLSKNKYAAMGAGAAVVAATAASIYWGVGPYPTRQLIAGGRFDSIAYFDRHAQPFFTKPAAAAKAWGWTMQEAAGNFTDTLSGDSEVLTVAGTPLYSRHTNIPRSDGFTWKAIAFNGTNVVFTAADNTKFDFTTNDFTIAVWINLASSGDQIIIEKCIGSCTGAGYMVYVGSGALYLFLKDAAANVYHSQLFPSLSRLHVWNHLVVSVNRSTNKAYGFVNGYAPIEGNISAVTGSLSNPNILNVGGVVGAPTRFKGNIAGLMIANGAMTQDEVTANYRAFKLPNGMNNIVGTISAAQTTHRAYEIANVGGWGTQLGAYAGNATAANVQFPTSYSSTLVSTANPGGLQTPAIAGMANVLGYAREFNSWVPGADPTLTADAAEAPDGLQTADRVAFANNGYGAVSYTHGVTAVTNAYKDGVYDPINNYIWFVPYAQAAQANWHYVNLNTGAIVAYAHGAGVLPSGAYHGGAYDPVNHRIYFAPSAQAPAANWHYVNCDTSTIVSYVHGAAVVANGYERAAYDPVNSRIYFGPSAQSAQANWHYVNLATGAVVAYAHGMGALGAYGYGGAVYDSVNSRIWFVPLAQANQANWHYVNLATGAVVAYAHGMAGVVASAYRGGAYDPENSRIYFAPNQQANQANWHYVNLATGTIVAYAHGATAAVGAYDGAVYNAAGRLYFAPTAQAAQPYWHYVNLATGAVVPYSYPGTALITGYIGGEYDPVNGRVYFAPYAVGPLPAWHYAGSGAPSMIQRSVVGGGTIAAGERWHGQLYYRYVSGAACDIRLYNGTTRYVTLDTTATWHKAWVDNYTAAETKQLYLSRNGGTDCVYDFSDAQYYSSQFYNPSVCTVGYTGAASYTCNSQNPIWTISSAHLATLPADFRRGEMTAVVSNSHHTSNGYTFSSRLFGPGYYSSRAVANTGMAFMNQAAGGGSEAFAVGRPLAPTEEKLTLSIPWDAVDGLTNTNPRKRFDGISNGYPATSVLSMRSPTETVGLSSTALAKTAMAASNTYPNPFGGIESFGVYTKPAHVVYPTTDPKHVLTLDTSGAGYLQNSSIPRFECPAGVDTANCTIWDMAEWGAYDNLAYSTLFFYDRINQTLLTPSGGANHNSTNSGLMARGAGRLAPNFARASTEAVKASSTAVADLGAATEVTLEATFRARTLNNYMSIVDSTKLTALTGVGMYLSAAGQLTCSVGARTKQTTPILGAGQWYHVACVFVKTGGFWEVSALYFNGVSTGGAAMGVQSAAITHGEPLTIGGSTNPSYFDGHIAEVMLWGRALSAPEILAHYKTTTQTGQTWNAAGQTNLVGHWPLNEYYLNNGTGVADDSGNGNNLTVVAGTPDGRHYAMPWPAGSGVTKLGVETYSSSPTYWSGSTIAPDAANPMSMMAWIRCPYDNDTQDIVAKQGGAPDYRMWLDSSGRLNCEWRDSGANATTSQNATDICDGVWHLVGCKLTYSAPNYVATSSINGGAFGNAGGNISGVLTGNAGAIRTLQIANGSDRFGESGLAIIKNYAISDSEIAGYAKFGADPSGGQLTYARTTTNNKVCHVTDIEPLRGTTVTCFPDSKFPYDAGGPPGSITMPRIIYEYSPAVAFPTSKAYTNYNYNSQALNAWTLTNVSAIADDTTFNYQAPDGSQTADKLSETAVNAVHSVENANTANVVQNNYASSFLFFRAGTGITWIKMYIKDSGGNYTWANISTTGTVGFSGVSGAGWTIGYTQTIGVNGWIQAQMSAVCNQNPCPDVRSGLCIETANNNAACPSYLGVITNNIYTWESVLASIGASYYDWWSLQHCPTVGAATSTCNSPTSQYVAAANISAWDRSSGVITNTTGIAWEDGTILDLHNGVNLNGSVLLTMNASAPQQLYIYDNAGVLQQRIAGRAANTIISNKLAWDSTGTFDTGNMALGSKRSRGYTYHNTYAGTWTTYTTDLGANWTPAAGTNLWIHMANTAATATINPFVHLRTTIHTR